MVLLRVEVEEVEVLEVVEVAVVVLLPLVVVEEVRLKVGGSIVLLPFDGLLNFSCLNRSFFKAASDLFVDAASASSLCLCWSPTTDEFSRILRRFSVGGVAAADFLAGVRLRLGGRDRLTIGGTVEM